MAMNLGSKCVRRFASARRFVAGRGGGDLESSTGLERASQIVRFYGTSSDESSDGSSGEPSDWFFTSNTGRLYFASLVVTCLWGGYLRFLTGRRESARITILESDIALRRAIEEKGVTRKWCEAKIAQLKLKQKTEPSEHDRFVMQIIKEWLQVLPKGEFNNRRPLVFQPSSPSSDYPKEDPILFGR